MNPAEKFFGETLRTLQFAQRAKKVRNKAVINLDSSGRVPELQAEISSLKQKLMQYEAQIRTMSESSIIRSRSIAEPSPPTNVPTYDEEKMKLEEINKNLWARIEALTSLLEKKERIALVSSFFFKKNSINNLFFVSNINL